MINKKGVSVMIGYILLIVFAVVISVVVYQWLRTYVPAEPLQCSAEISLFIKEASFDSSQLTLTLKNNGKFNVAGYFIHAKNSSEQELATIDLSNYTNDPNLKFGNSVLFLVGAAGTANSFKPGQQATHIFNIPASLGNLISVRVVPTIFKEENNRNIFVSCGDSRTEGLVGEPGTGTISVCFAPSCNPIDSSQYCLNGQWASCISGQICNNGVCTIPAGTYSCANYCIDLPSPDYSTGSCVYNLGSCQSKGGILNSGGDIYCPALYPKCCCIGGTT